MKIVDLSHTLQSDYFCCLEEWSADIKEAGNHKQLWYERMKDKGLRVKFAVDENNIAGGMIQYLPIEQSFVEGKDLYVILCIWIHGHKQGRGDYRKQGMGKALLNAAEEDVKSLGSKGIVAWGLSLPFFMRASWFKRNGYKVIDKDGMMRLLWKTFSDNAESPKFMKPTKIQSQNNNKVNITLFKNGWCPAMNIGFERMKRAALEFSDKTSVTEIDTFDKETQLRYGISDAIYINEKSIRNGPPPKYESLRKKIEKKVKKLK